jgi:hypothetical protein
VCESGVLPTFLRARAYCLLSTVDLVQGQKNVLDSYLDGVRIKRTSYSY